MKTLIEAWNHNNLNKAVISFLMLSMIMCCCILPGFSKRTSSLPTATPVTRGKVIPTPEAPIQSTDTALPPSTTPEQTATSETKATTAPTVVVVSCPPNGAQQTGTVLDVIDGVTLRVLIDGATYTVKYIGLQAPAKGQYYFQEAKQKNGELVFAKKVVLIAGEVDKDPAGTLPRYVLLDNTLINAELLKQGCATLDPAYAESPCLSSYQSAQQNAQLAKIGQWGAPPTFAANTIIQPTSAVVVPIVNPTSSGGGKVCCKYCTTGKPCGDTCIPQNHTCHTAPGCAC